MASAGADKHLVEEARAVALSAHCAAGLATAARARTAARLLRSAEALARSTVAVLACRLPAQSDVASGPAGHRAPSSRARRRAKKEKSKLDVEVAKVKPQPVDAVCGGSTAAALPTAPLLGPDAGVAAKLRSAQGVQATSSRERSPRRPSSLLASSPSASLRACAALPAASGGFSAGQVAVLDGLVLRTELTCHHVTLRSFDETTSRWAASLVAGEETISVKARNLKALVPGPEPG